MQAADVDPEETGDLVSALTDYLRRHRKGLKKMGGPVAQELRPLIKRLRSFGSALEIAAADETQGKEHDDG